MQTRKLLLIASFILYLAALTQPGYFDSKSDPAHLNNPAGYTGAWILLLLGWIGAPFPWLGNGAVAAAWIFIIKRKPGLAIASSALAIALMLSFLTFKSVLCDEGGGTCDVTGLGLGYWLWVASAAFALGAAVAIITDRVPPPPLPSKL